MKRRVVWLGITLAALAILLIGIQGSIAALIGKTGRVKSVEIESLQYVWELVWNSDGHVICYAIVEHPTRPTNEETITICAEQIFPPEPTLTPFPSRTITPDAQPTPTVTPGPEPEPFDLAAFFRSVSWRFIRTQKFTRTIQVPLPDMVLNLSVPTAPTTPLFATIAAYEPVVGQRITEIRGSLNGWDFTCPSNRCDVPITGDSVLEFWAISSLGDESPHVQGTLRRLLTDQGIVLKVEAVTPVTLFQDYCAGAWNVPQPTNLDWARLPLTPDELNTNKEYQYLSGRLIASGLVKAGDCPGGGLYSSGAPNACGLAKAASTAVEWQNQYDMMIWDTGRDLGVPPRLIKVMFEQESQFWPGNGRTNLYEYGLGQMNQSGLDVALRWDNELYREICNRFLLDCSLSYGRLPSWLQATLRGALLNSYNVECSDCPNGINVARAFDSIPVVTRTLRANCRQVKYLSDRAGLAKISYEDYWRLTFASYHSGFRCVADALDYVAYNRLPADWGNFSRFLDCAGANAYVDNVWKSLSEFEQHRIKYPENSKPVNLVTFSPRAAPTLTPTPVRALSHIRVLVYIDNNSNNLPDADERVDGVRVEVRFPDGTVSSGVTSNGEVNIDLTGRPVDDVVVVALPELYREEKVRILKDGEIPVIFRLDQPVLPPGLP